MPTVLLLRHGRSTANTSGVLAGWTPGVALDDRGREQAEAIALRLGGLPLAAIVASPLQRCQETVAPLVKKTGLKRVTEKRLGECRYGDWTGRKLSELFKEPLWKVVQAHPSAAVFPGPEGESMAAMQARGVAAIRDWDARIAAEHGPGAVWVACSHGDVIKAIVADAMATHLDNFQRILIDPGSITAISYTETRPFVLRVNDVGGDVAAYTPPPPAKAKRGRKRSSDAVVGGGAGA
ncbi:histidine phosphatase family protein [Sporichthya sp.]|uniref:histidine phosphatase family protein n=1 Tax=Sporichthya sp. TaxID=65475 RepID=UPI0018277699|nr:histidine phosphatase family protein [Sporichthya sp.]MBA3743870.1 MSMEG_4193 family putative phosphomutase [Sporichthya sp.]